VRRVLATPALLAALVLPLAACGDGGDGGSGGSQVAAAVPVAGAEAPAAGITVSGTGSVSAVPDRGDFTFGVETQGTTAVDALTTNATSMQKVLAALKSAGIADDDLQTQQVFVSARYSSDGQAIVGYSAVNSVLAKVRDLETAGAVIDAAVGAGANQVYSLALAVSKQDEAYGQALDLALANARAKAETLAKAAGVRLLKVTSVTESGGATPTPVPFAVPAAEAAASTPIVPGTQEIQANVTVTFAIS